MSSGYRMAADSLCLYCVDSNHKKKITVSGKNFDGSGDVALFVKNENGIPVYADQAARTSDNKFAFEFMLDAEPGRYSVGLSSKKRNDKYTEAFELISGNNTNISLDSFCCKNAQGEPLSSFDLQNETEISFGLKRAGGGETQANIIMALYKDNKLIHSEKKSNVKIGTEVLPISFTYESTYDADRVSVYIWDEKLTPLFDAKMYENGKDVLISFN